MDWEYDAVLLPVFGGRKQAWRPAGRETITQSEHFLLETLVDTHLTSTMPPGAAPNPTKKKIRPSSATAQLQTHPQYTSGLFDNVRPSTAMPGGPGERRRSQAAGARLHTARQTCPTPDLKPRRRLTVGAVDGIAHLEAGKGHLGLGLLSGIGSACKGKVRILVSYIFSR